MANLQATQLSIFILFYFISFYSFVLAAFRGSKMAARDTCIQGHARYLAASQHIGYSTRAFWVPKLWHERGIPKGLVEYAAFTDLSYFSFTRT